MSLKRHPYFLPDFDAALCRANATKVYIATLELGSRKALLHTQLRSQMREGLCDDPRARDVVGLSRPIDRLEDAGPAPDDERGNIVIITEAGARIPETDVADLPLRSVWAVSSPSARPSNSATFSPS